VDTGGATALEEGGTYMWIVYAYSGDGQLLSTSEHYFDVREPSFVVRKPQKGDELR
jgi:hypothetical protein